MGDLQAQLVEIQESYQLLQELYTNLSSSLHQDGGDEALSVSLELENTKDLLWKSQRELERLRQHMMEVEEERDHEVLKAEEVVKEYRVQMERLSHERQDVEALCEERINEISDLQEKLTQFEQIMVEKEEEYARIQEERIQTAQSVDNLQHALEEFQTSKLKW